MASHTMVCGTVITSIRIINIRIINIRITSTRIIITLTTIRTITDSHMVALLFMADLGLLVDRRYYNNQNKLSLNEWSKKTTPHLPRRMGVVFFMTTLFQQKQLRPFPRRHKEKQFLYVFASALIHEPATQSGEHQWNRPDDRD